MLPKKVVNKALDSLLVALTLGGGADLDFDLDRARVVVAM